MQRVAFQLTLRAGAEEAYDASHRAVWPEMLELLTRAGIREYSIFRRDRLLVLCMRVEDFDESWSIVESDPVNTRWQAAMAPYFEPASGLLAGERFRMMREVFYLP
jgi:L-rhamnose mutarotase